jgi:hypothetical protein
LAASLLEKEVLTGDEIDRILQGRTIRKERMKEAVQEG